MEQGIMRGFFELSPAFRLASTAFWVAWIALVFSSDCVLVSSVNPYVTTNNAFIFSTISISATLFAAGCLPKVFERLISSPPALVAASVLACLSTFGIFLEGLLPSWLFVLCAAASGLSTGVLVLRAASLYAESNPQIVIIAASLAAVFGVLIYSFVIMCATVFPTVALAIFASILPALVMLTSLVPGPNEAPVNDEASYRLSPMFWRIVVFCGIFVFVLGATRGYYPQAISVQESSQVRNAAAAIVAVAGTALAVVASLKQRGESFRTLLYTLFIGSLVVIVLLVALGPRIALGGAVADAANVIVNVTAWCLFSGISFQSGMSPVRVFGFGFGFVSLSIVLGFVSGAFFDGVIPSAYATMFGTALLVACIVIAMFMVRRGDLDAASLPTPQMHAVVEESDGDDKDRTDEVRDGQPEEHDDRKMGKFRQKCLVVADEHALSARETEVFLLMAKRMEAQAIAEKLCISYNTTRTHIMHIYAKLDVHSRRELFDLVDSFRI